MTILEKAMALLKDGRERTTGELAERTGISKRSMRETLLRARAAGLVTSDQIDKCTNAWRATGVQQ